MAKSVAANKLNKEKGQLVVEAMIAIVILVTATLTFVGILSRSLGFNRVITDQYIGTYLAAEGVEVIKNIIDANYLQSRPWNAGGFSVKRDWEIEYDSEILSPSSNRYFCLDKSTGRYGYKECSSQDGKQTTFKRVVSTEPIGSNEIKVNSSVTWRNRGLDYQINLEDHFFNWR
ncbi:MAG: hypothetical protein AAB885_00695 [Patescibacteria group bacterium]